jgi:MoaA/NifB/PqqE/SkfB family radical SAM enzyme
MNNVFTTNFYFPLLAHMVITRNCNLSCGYCNEYNKAALPVPIDQLKRQVDQLHKLGTLALTFTGGEPLLHPDLCDILRYAKSKFLILGLISNAYLLTENKIEELNAAGLKSLQISIDGLLPNSVTVKALIPLKRRLESIARKARFMVNINSVIGPTFISELLEISQYARSQGFTFTAQVMNDHRGQILLSEEKRSKYICLVKEIRNPI